MDPSLSLHRTKQPLVLIAILFAVGIILQQIFQFSWRPTLLLFTGASVAWMFVSWKPLRPPFPILPLVITAGALATASQNLWILGDSPKHLSHLTLRVPQHLQLRGIIYTDPVIRGVGEHPNSHSSKKVDPTETTETTARSEFRFKISAVKFHTTWETAEGLVQVQLRDLPLSKLQTLDFGQELEVDGVLQKPPASRNFGLFDYASYLQRAGVSFILQAEGKDSITVLGPASAYRWIFEIRKELADRMTLGIHDDTLATGIIRGMLLGYREDIPPDVNDAFRRTGTLHVFAISGSHISLIALSFLIGLRQVRFPQRWACLIVLPLLIFYVCATGLRASAIRSLVMAGVVIAGWSLQRPSALLNNLATSALIILAWDPLQLFDAGFQLSFVVVASLILISPPISNTIQSWLEPDPLIPRSYIPRWRLALIPITQWSSALVGVCIAAWIGSFGLNLYYFNLVSFVSLLANLLIVPLASISVALGMISLILGSLWSQLAITLNSAHAFLIHVMVWICDHLSDWSFSYFYVPQPGIIWVVLLYLVFGAFFFLWLQKRRLYAVALACVTCLIFGLFVLKIWNQKSIRIDVMDVGGGQAVLITGPHFERILIDAGSKSQGRFIVEPFLRSRGVNRIDLAIITHGDASHYGGFSELLPHIPIKEFIVADANFRSKPYQQLLQHFAEAKIPVQKWITGDKRQLSFGIMEALWPTKDFNRQRADDQTLILRLNTPSGNCLFSSDAGETLEKLISAHLTQPCSFLVQGLHSNEESLSESYLEQLKPKMIALNTAEFPLKAYPSPQLQERLQQQRRAQIFRTDQTGGVIFELKPGDTSVKIFLSKGLP
jgi:competence protein ComEC